MDLKFFAWKAGKQIGIDFRSKCKDMSDQQVRALSQTTMKFQDFFATKTQIVEIDLVEEMGKARIAWRTASDDIAKQACEGTFRALVIQMVGKMNDQGMPVKPEQIAPELEWESSEEDTTE